MPFVVIDGLDASGKTTQAQLLANYLRKAGKSVCLRFHPSDDNVWGIYTRRFLQAEGRNAHFASALFYMLDVINSILRYSWRNEDYVIFVRYLLGTAYLPSPIDRVAFHFFDTLVPKPDSVFYFDVESEVAFRRVVSRAYSQREMFEKPERLEKMRRKGMRMAILAGWNVVDGSDCEIEIESKIRSLLKI